MRRHRHLALALLIGCNFTVNVREAGEVHVATADNKPLIGGRVVVHSESEPHAKDDDPTVELETDDNGKAMIESLAEKQSGCIFIPHGVGAYTQHVCIDHPDHGAKAIVLREQPWVIKFTKEDAGYHCGGKTGAEVVKD